MPSPYWKPYYEFLVVSFVSPCGCMDQRREAIGKELRLVVCERHAERIKEIVSKRRPLEGPVIPGED